MMRDSTMRPGGAAAERVFHNARTAFFIRANVRRWTVINSALGQGRGAGWSGDPFMTSRIELLAIGRLLIVGLLIARL